MKGKPFVPDVIAIPLKMDDFIRVGLIRRDSKERKVESVKRKVVELFSASDTRTCVAKRLHSFTLYVLHFTLSLRLRDANHLVDGDRFRVLAATP